MGYIDLHVHSNASDGTLSPAEVVRLAGEAKLEAIALTDHDTTAGVAEAAREAERLGIELIPGIEVSGLWEGHEIHILGLFVSTGETALSAMLAKMRQKRDARNEEMLARFAADGIELTREELCAGNPETVITRAHVARALLARGLGSSMKQVFQKYLEYGGRYCPHKEAIPPQTVVETLLADGAFVSLAHPFQYKLGDPETKRLISELAGFGMQGLEVYHSSNNSFESQKLREWARELGLLPTGGSDFHGANKPDISIGVGHGGLRVSSLLLDDIKKSLGKTS